MLRFLAVLLLLSVADLAQGTVLQVPSPAFPSLSAAVEAAKNDDLILVGPGVYAGNLVISGKTLTIRSTRGPRATILDGGGKGSVVRFKGMGGFELQLEGFTIARGGGEPGAFGRKSGGGLFLEGGRAVILGNIVAGNEAMIGAGMHCTSEAVIRRNLFAFNHAIQEGGCAYFEKAGLEFTDNYVIGNYGGLASGGCGIYVRDKPAVIRRNVFFENWSRMGGALLVQLCSPVIDHNVFKSNRGCRAGGILVQNKGTVPRIENNLIWDNVACFGGGICCLYGATPHVFNNRFLGNHSINQFCLDTVNPGSADEKPNPNLPDFSGGGILCWGGCDAEIAGNFFKENWAWFHGGAIGCKASSPLIVNDTMCGNSSNCEPGGLYCDETSHPKAVNCIFWNEEAAEEIMGKPEVSYCCVRNGWNGEGNLDTDPGFLDPARPCRGLGEDSALRDAGLAAAPGMPEKDIDGDPRRVNGRVDIGADEWTANCPERIESEFWRGTDFFAADLDQAAPSLRKGLLVPSGLDARRPPLDRLISQCQRCIDYVTQDKPRWHATSVRDPTSPPSKDRLLEVVSGKDAARSMPMPQAGGMGPAPLWIPALLIWRNADAKGGASAADAALAGLSFSWIPFCDADGGVLVPGGALPVIARP